MDRLTEKAWANLDPWECCGQDNYCRRGCHEQGGCTNGCIVPKIYCRLAKYEDTGLTPEEFRAYWNFFEDFIDAQKASEALDYLRNLAKADRGGRLIVLPCKAGDIVYLFDPQYPGSGRSGLPLLRCRINEFSNDGSHTCMVLDIEEKWGSMRRFTAVGIEKYGKVVFRTEDEAVATLTKEQA